MSDSAGVTPLARVVVSDDGAVIRVMTYAHGMREPLAVAELDVLQAARTAAELQGAVVRHLVRARNGRIGVRREP